MKKFTITLFLKKILETIISYPHEAKITARALVFKSHVQIRGRDILKLK